MAMFDFVPEDVIYEILLRLPAKSIRRARCVSQAWRSSLASHQFIKAHFDFHIHDHENTLLTASIHCPPSILTFPPNREGVLSRKIICSHISGNVKGTCHGLVLLVHGISHRMVLWNPLTSEAMEVPKVPVCYGLDTKPRFEKVLRGWNPHTVEAVEVPRIRTFGRVLYGFGCCQDDDDHHKILRISKRNRFNYKFFVDVYNVKLNTWRRVTNLPYDYRLREEASGVFVNGCLHWLGYRRRRGSPAVIVAFDLAREVFDEIPLPTDGVRYSDGLPVLGGCLAFQAYYSGAGVWVMKEYGVQESWTKLTTNPFKGTPVWLLREEEEEEEEIVLANWRFENKADTYDMQLLAYNLRNGVWRDIVVAGDPLGIINRNNPLISFKESLWSVPR